MTYANTIASGWRNPVSTQMLVQMLVCTHTHDIIKILYYGHSHSHDAKAQDTTQRKLVVLPGPRGDFLQCDVSQVVTIGLRPNYWQEIEIGRTLEASNNARKIRGHSVYCHVMRGLKKMVEV